MAAKVQNINFSYLSKEPSLRSDVNYIRQDLQISQEEYYLFDELFEIVNDNGVNFCDLGEFEYAEIGDVSSTEDISPVQLDIDAQNELNANYFKKIAKGDIIKVRENDILISKVRPYLKKIILIDNTNCDVYYTSSFIHIRPLYSPHLLFYLLKDHFINNLNSLSRQGKGYPTISEKDLHYVKFRKKDIDIVLAKEMQILPQIKSLETKIKKIKRERISDTEIINEEFCNYFQWDLIGFSDQKSIKKYQIDFSTLSNNYDLRISAKFHRPSGSFVYKDLQKRNSLRIKNFISEPITLGASVAPSDFDASGEYYYISMATVKNYKVELDDSQLLSEDYVMLPKNSKKTVNLGDIIMTRSGAAIGKFAIIEEDIKAIYADFTMRIRLENINLRFAYYYFRSIYFQYLIEINYKGLQNNNIFPNQIQEFPIPNISIEEQKKLANRIKTRIEKQNQDDIKIRELRNEIDNVIMSLLV